MNKVTEYNLLEENRPANLNFSVMDAIRNGWQPFGSACVVKDSLGNVRCYQAVVKMEDEWSNGAHGILPKP